MLIRKGFKYRLEPNKSQLNNLVLFAGHNRAVWNKALSITKDRLERKEPLFWYNEMVWNMTHLWKKSEEFSWLNEAPSQTLQQTLRQFDRALRDSFDKKQNKQFPKFKKKGVRDSFSIPQKFKVKNNRIYLPKLGWVKFRKSREVQGKMRSVTVKRHGKHWFVSILCEIEIKEPVHVSTSVVGVDRGVNILAACSDGKNYTGVRPLQKYERQIAKAQRALSRKVKFSNNWYKQKEHIGKIHSKVTNVRKDNLHKISTEICKNHAVVVMEKLNVQRMLERKHGWKCRKAKSNLNKHILDSGWSTFADMIEYKQRCNGGFVEYVLAAYTSQRCSKCSYVDEANRTTQSKFKCLKCGHSDNADFNASKNILAAGHAVLACGVDAI